MSFLFSVLFGVISLRGISCESRFFRIQVLKKLTLGGLILMSLLIGLACSSDFDDATQTCLLYTSPSPRD